MRIAIALCVITPLFAGEYAVLHTGFRLHAERHEVAGASTRLHTSSGTLELPTSDIAYFEVEEYNAPLAQKAKEPEPTPAPAPQLTPRELIHQAAILHGLRPEFVSSVASAESAFRTSAVSPKGALGLMQLMPATAAELRVNPLDPAQNAEAGARYLKQLLLKYAGTRDPVRLALAAYNAGPGAVDRYKSIPPYRETQAYVDRVVRQYLRATAP